MASSFVFYLHVSMVGALCSPKPQCFSLFVFGDFFSFLAFVFHGLIYMDGNLAYNPSFPAPVQCSMIIITEGRTDRLRVVQRFHISLNRRNGRDHLWWLVWVRPTFTEQIIYSIKHGKIFRIWGKLNFEIRSSYKLWEQGRTSNVQLSSTWICHWYS